MSRARNVKPGFFTHEGLQDLEQANAGKYPMLVFEGLWGQCDRNGVFLWNNRVLKLHILPFLSFEIGETLDILAGAGYIQKYAVDGKNYGIIPGFKKHQSICLQEQKNKNIFPLPPISGETGDEPEKFGIETNTKPSQSTGNPKYENEGADKTDGSPNQDGLSTVPVPSKDDTETVLEPHRNGFETNPKHLKSEILKSEILKSEILKSHTPKPENADSEKSVCGDLTDPKKLFLNYWQHTPDIFNFLAKTEYPKDWARFWESSGTTCGQVKTALENFIADVRSGAIPRRYVPSTPDGFVLRGWILKCQTRFQTKTAPPSGAAQTAKPPKKSLF